MSLVVWIAYTLFTAMQCCPYAQSEIAAASLLIRFGTKHTAGPYNGSLTLTKSALDCVVAILNEEFGTRLDELPFRSFRLCPDTYHADILWHGLHHDQSWGGSWGHICEYAGWVRPSLIMVDTDNDDSADEVTCLDKFDRMGEDALRKEARELEAKCAELKAKLRSLTQANSRLVIRNKQLQDEQAKRM